MSNGNFMTPSRNLFFLFVVTITISRALCNKEQEEKGLDEKVEKVYHFSKKTGDIKLEDIQQFDEVDQILDEDIDLRVKQATKKMMAMTIEDNVDHIDDDTQNFDMDTMPKDFGPTMSARRPYKLPNSKKGKKKKGRRALADIDGKRRRMHNLFEKAKIWRGMPQKQAENRFKGQPVQVLSLHRGSAVLSRPISKADLVGGQPDGERSLRQIHVHTYMKDKAHKRKMKKKMRREIRKRKMKFLNRFKKKRRLRRNRNKRRRQKVSRSLKMNVKILRTKKRKHKKHHSRRKRQLMLPGMGGGGGGGVVVAPNQGAGIANAQIVVNSLGTPATIPYAEGNAVPAYAPEDTAPKVIVTRMKMPSNLPY